MSTPAAAARNPRKSAPRRVQGTMQANPARQLFLKHVALGLKKSIDGTTEEILPAGQLMFSPT